MSLINQMLRDLENRRKTDDRQLPSGEKPAVVGPPVSSRRLFYLLTGGAISVLLVWFALELFPAEKFTTKPRIKIVPQDEQSQRIAIVRGQELFAALEEKTTQLPLETVEQEKTLAVSYSPSSHVESPAADNTATKPEKRQAAAKTAINEKGAKKPEVVEKAAYSSSVRQFGAATAPLDPVIAAETRPLSIEKTQPAALVGTSKADPVAEVKKPVQDKPVLLPRLKSSATGENFTSTLLTLGVLESVGSARLMFEFEQLPDYRWKYRDKANQQLLIQFKKTGARQALSIPQLKGPLLKQLILEPEQEQLKFLIDISKPVAVKTLELPADPFHGHRLLVELYFQQSVAVIAPEPQVSTTAKKAPAKKTAKQSIAKKVSKKEKTLSRAEQAQQAYDAALEQLQREDLQAAEANLSHALIMQPRLLDARLQLIDLLQTLQRAREAEKQMELGLQLHPDNPELRKKYARQLLLNGLSDGALNVLQSEPLPEISSDLEYHALLAALLQETGQHKTAVKSYSQLLKFRPREALWWMGLAISYEQSQDYARAKEAYRQALSLSGLRPDLQDYIRNRLQIL